MKDMKAKHPRALMATSARAASFPARAASFPARTASFGTLAAATCCALLTGCTSPLPIPPVPVQVVPQEPKPTADSYFPMTPGSWWRYELVTSVSRHDKKRWYEVRALDKSEIPDTVPPGVDRNNVYVLEVRDLPNPKSVKWDKAPTKINKTPPRLVYFTIKDGKACPINGADGVEFKQPRPGVPIAPKEGDHWTFEKADYSVTIMPQSNDAVVKLAGPLTYFDVYSKGVGRDQFQWAHSRDAIGTPDFERYTLIEHHIEPDK